SPISISLYTTDSTGEKVLFERHYSSAEQGGYTFRQFDAVEQAFSVEVNDRWNHTSSRLDTVLTPLFETQILGKVNNVNRWNPYDGNTWDNANYLYYRSATMDQYVPGASSSTYILPAYLTIDMGVPAKYSRFKYYTRGRSPVYSAWAWYEFEVWGTNDPKALS